jgi:hypothetical protein
VVLRNQLRAIRTKDADRPLAEEHSGSALRAFLSVHAAAAIAHVQSGQTTLRLQRGLKEMRFDFF